MYGNELEVLTLLGNSSPDDFKDNEVERSQIISAAQKVLSALQTKEEKAFEITFTQPIVFATLQTCLDLGLWAAWTAVGGSTKTAEELSKMTKPQADPTLIRRLLRLLGAVNIIKEVAEDTYTSTPFSLALGDKESLMAETIQCRTHHWQDGCANLPKYLAKIGYKNPEDAKNSNYADWCPEKLTFFDKCMAAPAYQDSFSGFMTAWAKYKLPWPEFYDTKSLVEGADLTDGGVLCVDIGGHHGVDLTRLLNKHPELPAGALVLEDLPEVLSGAKGLSEKITAVPHDFFQPQPVQGSRAYYFHSVFHDWPDAVASQILRHVAAVMKKGYSKLLINDMVLPATGTSAIQASMDVEMMSILSSYERTESMWVSLVASAGLKIIKIWPDGRGNESLIEAELA
ncbi:S-adenosyl-L-methionine-dependent methyltransferase [Biscogniauxia sp. FL1348]|nr:S-adenosyl-L-methionine-dependent methyltransferase [Biscogniauxia sp. FL1348]